MPGLSKIAVLSVIRNHAYKWKGDIWLQALGVPTGLRLSGIIGRITMDDWRKSIINLMDKQGMENYLTEKYVDDCKVVLENLEHGARWDGDKIKYNPEDVEEDKQSSKALDEITMGVWQDMVSGITPGLKFTTDFCSNNKNGKVEMLDFQLWKEREDNPSNPGGTRETLRYTFYEKPMSNNKVMESDSAMPHRVKIASLAQEGVRSRDFPNQFAKTNKAN